MCYDKVEEKILSFNKKKKKKMMMMMKSLGKERTSPARQDFNTLLIISRLTCLKPRRQARVSAFR
ncbi:hypothetical protein T4E_11328 [Trichinella pseudospiralis]|uniref:Uncharacterized protein n=1 Tax=Trichinella pseudospiralis TaxID=6337 RepID=A0A0V0Y8M4_TRIPS|nr:hypothetical protein T4E_11328 [Trichinella pseudospiralis]